MNLPPPHGIVRFDALAAADGHGLIAAPASLLVQIDPAPGCQRRVIATLRASGHPDEIDRHPQAKSAHVVDRCDCVLLPGLVNAHTHLDLTHIGPQPFDPAGGFAGWADMIRRHRLTDAAAIAASVRRGVELNLAAGVVAVGDIAGAVMGKASPAAVEALQATEMNGVSFVEFFAIGPHADANVDRAVEVVRTCSANRPAHSTVTVGLSPHAPYSVSTASYRRAIDRRHDPRVPLMTHLAESPDERELIQHGRGPIRDMLERIGVWDQAAVASFGQGKSPARHLVDAGLDTGVAPLIFVHINDIAEDDIAALLGMPNARMVYCPRASEYFLAERHFGPHKYRELNGETCWRPGIGTDSIVNLPHGSDRTESGQFGPLAEIRRLFGRDDADPSSLIWMATAGGADALDGVVLNYFLREIDTNLAGLVAVPVADSDDPLTAVLASDSPPELLVLGTPQW